MVQFDIIPNLASQPLISTFLSDDCQLSLQSEIQSSIRSNQSKKKSNTDEFKMEMAVTRPSKFKNAFETYKIGTANKMHIGGLSSDSPIPCYNPGKVVFI